MLRDVGGGFGSLLRAWRAAQAAGGRAVDHASKSPGIRAAPGASIVVLPFANLSDDPSQQYFADGITCELTTDLARIPDDRMADFRLLPDSLFSRPCRVGGPPGQWGSRGIVNLSGILLVAAVGAWHSGKRGGGYR